MLDTDPAVRRIDPAPERLLTPVEWPNKLICYPANYEKHREEMNSQNRADKNRFFLKANSSLSGPNDPIVMPTVEAVRSTTHASWASSSASAAAISRVRTLPNTSSATPA